jgi:hypothetical protein
MARVVDNTNVLTSAAWAGDFFDRDHMIPGGAKLFVADWVGIAHTVTTTAAALTNATSLAVQPIDVPIASGQQLTFATVTVTVTADTPLGASVLPVSGVTAGIASAVAATFTPNVATPFTVFSGTIVGRTIAERDALQGYGPAAAADDEVYIVCFDVYDVAIHNDVELYRPNSIVKETFLPGYAAVAAGVKTKLRAAYVCTIGAN